MKSASLYLQDPLTHEEHFLKSFEGEASIGTGDLADIKIEDLRCSPIHALIETNENDDRITIIDLGSRFGTYVDDSRVYETKLREGDTFKIGNHTVVVRKPKKSDKVQKKTRDSEKVPYTHSKETTGLITDSTLLQVSLFWGEQLLEVRTFTPGTNLTLGADKEATFPVTLMDSRFQQVLFKIADYSRYDLTLFLPPEASGLAWFGQDPVSVDSLRHRGMHTDEKGDLQLKLRVGDRAEIHVGELTLSFRFVNPSEKIPPKFFDRADKHFAKIFLLLFGLYALVFWGISQVEIKQKEVTLKDVPKHLKRVIMDAGIQNAMKKQRAAIGQLAQTLQGGRARSEEGKAKAKTQPKKAKKTKKSKKAKNKKATKKRTSKSKKAARNAKEAPKVDLDAAFTDTSKQAVPQNISVVGKKSDGNTAAALAEGGFARGRYGQGAGGGGKSVGIGSLSGLETGGGLGAGDEGLNPSKGREIKLPESEELVILGGLDPDVIAAIIRRYLPQIRHCYEQQLAVKPNLKGKVAVSFIIGGNGGVKTAQVIETSLKDAATEACIIGKVKNWKFPKPRGGGTVGVKYPFLLMSNTGK